MLKTRIKKISKVVGINIIIIGISLISPAVFLRLYLKLKPVFSQTKDHKAYYPTYSNKEFSTELNNEFSKLATNYRSFIGWRREKVKFKYTNISGPYNARKSKGESINNSVWFFGGSTMWGTGASDLQTIPSHFNSITNIPVYNFGETGWTSRQSLNQLINAIGDNNNPSVVVFYDGANDVLNQCRIELKLVPSHTRESQLQKLLDSSRVISFKNNKLIKFILSPYIAFAKELNIDYSSRDLFNLKRFDCDTNKAKARSVAQHLVNNWRTAHYLSKSNNFKFYGVLQATLFSTETNSEYLNKNQVKIYPEYKRQFNAVYPLILEEISHHCELEKEICSFMIDGTDWLDGNNNIFIDHAHVNSFGNKVIAQRLKSLMKK